MLKLRPLRSAQDRRILLEEFSPVQTTWLVSDLRSKFEIQNELMDRQSYFEDLMVMRASELWTLLLRRDQPHCKKVSRDYIRTWIRQHLRQEKKASPGAEDLLLDLMDEFAPILVHQSGLEIFQEWLQSRSGLQNRLSPWLEQATELFQGLLQQGSIAPRWMAALLTSLDSNWETHWTRPLVVDLGIELSMPEAELLQRLSRHQDVLVLEPWIPQDARFFYLKKPYEQLRSAVAVGHEEIASSKVPGEFHRLTSPLAEVRLATFTIRQWLDSGVAPDQIALIAPNIEDYWPLVEPCFQQEGIPVAKDSTTRLQSLASVQTWLSRLRTLQRSFDYSDLQSTVYSRTTMPMARFEKFEGLFKNLLDFGDLQRDPELAQVWTENHLPKAALSAKAAMAWLVKWWPPDAAAEPLEPILREMLEPGSWQEGISSAMMMDLSQWIYWAERAAGRLEILVRRGDRQGVQFENLTSADSTRLQRRFFLGLTESQLLPPRRGLLSPSEVEQLLIDTGFHCLHPEQSSLHYELAWLAQNPSPQDCYCTIQSSATGAPETPHAFWLSHAPAKVVTTLPPSTRWDVLMAQTDWQILAQERDWDSVRVSRLQTQIQADGTPQAFEKVQVPLRSLSPSQLQVFQDCPFRFAASWVFRLLDEPEVDLDPDSRSAGQLVHRLLEELGREPRRDWTDLEIRELLDLNIGRITLGEKKLWPIWREKLVRLGQRFLLFEKNGRESSPTPVRTLAVEKKWTIPLAGREWKLTMDRVDQRGDSGLVVIDYKASNRQYAVSAWQRENHAQLAFYAWLIQSRQLPEWQSFALAGAFYYVYRDFSLHGASVEEDKKFAALSENLNWVEGLVNDFVGSLERGEFPARPREPEICTNCAWSQLCRAPHLNQ